MTPDTIDMIRRIMPPDIKFPYFPDRESAWVMAQLMQGDASISALRCGSGDKLLGRPILQPLVASCGGRLLHRDVLALAHADKSIDWSNLSKAARLALDDVYGLKWEDYILSFSRWGGKYDWQFEQMSRPGGNLVIQLGFPAEHGRIFGQSFPQEMRKAFEYSEHPIRTDGPPTLAWARLDICLDTGTALIEEVQSDWIRLFERRLRRRHGRLSARDRELRVWNAYRQTLTKRYAKTWPQVILLAALYMLREEFGVRRVWMHRPETGARLKSIQGRHPPRSLYSQLPKSFCFTETCEPPPFLWKHRRRHLRHMLKQPEPLFWALSM